MVRIKDVFKSIKDKGYKFLMTTRQNASRKSIFNMDISDKLCMFYKCSTYLNAYSTVCI